MAKTGVEHLTKFAAENCSKAKIIAVASGKGGVGKTNISANLAICLAAAGKRVAVFDADFGLANLDIVLGTSSKYNLSHFIKGRKTLEQICQPSCGGIDIICGLSGLEGLTNMSEFNRERIIKSLDVLADNYDVIIVDTSAGINKMVLSFCRAADHIVLVSTTEPTSITDVYTLLKTLTVSKYDGRYSLLVNMAVNVTEGKKVYRQISLAATQFLNTHIHHAGVMVKDEHLPLAVKKRQPVVIEYPKCRCSQTLMTVAARLSKVPRSHMAGESFFKKVVNWFF